MGAGTNDRCHTGSLALQAACDMGGVQQDLGMAEIEMIGLHGGRHERSVPHWKPCKLEALQAACDMGVKGSECHQHLGMAEIEAVAHADTGGRVLHHRKGFTT